MKKFIFFDIDDTLIFEDKKLSDNTINFIKQLPIEYGICTNRPSLDIPDLDYLKESKFYICEGGVVSYDSNKREYMIHEGVQEISHDLIRKEAINFALENGLNLNFSQNSNRKYTSTLYTDIVLKDSLLNLLAEKIISTLNDSYEFTILNNRKISFTIKGVLKHSMINHIAEKDTSYFLISDDEKMDDKFEFGNLSYVSVNPENYEFNKNCIFVSEGDFEERLINATLYIINK